MRSRVSRGVTRGEERWVVGGRLLGIGVDSAAHEDQCNVTDLWESAENRMSSNALIV